MQHSYNDAHAKIESDLITETLPSSEESKGQSNQKESKQLQSEYGDDNFKYDLPEFPATHDDLQTYNKGVKTRIEKKYGTLIKNVHFYLSYLFLEVQDYRNCLKHADILIDQFKDRLTTKTLFTVYQYMGEANCMLGNHDEAMSNIEDSEQLDELKPKDPSDPSSGKLRVQTIADNIIQGDKLSQHTTAIMNKVAILLCAGDLFNAK